MPVLFHNLKHPFSIHDMRHPVRQCTHAYKLNGAPFNLNFYESHLLCRIYKFSFVLWLFMTLKNVLIQSLWYERSLYYEPCSVGAETSWLKHPGLNLKQNVKFIIYNFI